MYVILTGKIDIKYSFKIEFEKRIIMIPRIKVLFVLSVSAFCEIHRMTDEFLKLPSSLKPVRLFRFFNSSFFHPIAISL